MLLLQPLVKLQKMLYAYNQTDNYNEPTIHNCGDVEVIQCTGAHIASAGVQGVVNAVIDGQLQHKLRPCAI